MPTPSDFKIAGRAPDRLVALRSSRYAWPPDALLYSATYYFLADCWHARITRPPAEIVAALSAPLLDDVHLLVLLDAEDRARRLGVNVALVHGFADGGPALFSQVALRRGWTDLVPMRMTCPWITCADT